MKEPYTQEQIDFLKKHVSGTHYRELAAALNEEFNTHHTRESVRAECRFYGLSNGFKPCRCSTKRSIDYTEEQIDFLKKIVPGNNYDFIVEEFNKRFNTNKSKDGIRSKCYVLGIKARLKKSHNGYKRNREIGYERIDDSGKGRKYITVKVAKNKWMKKHKYIYEQAHGTIPEGYIIKFLDGNSLNCDLNNLVLISRAESLPLHTKCKKVKNPDMNKSIIANTRLKNMIKKKEKEQKNEK